MQRRSVAQLAEVFDHAANVESARLAHVGAPADANGVEEKAIAYCAIACGNDRSGDEGVVAYREEVCGNRNQDRGDDRVAADSAPSKRR